MFNMWYLTSSLILQVEEGGQEGRQLSCARGAQAGFRHEDPWYQPGLSQGPKGAPAFPTSPDQQWRVH